LDIGQQIRVINVEEEELAASELCPPFTAPAEVSEAGSGAEPEPQLEIDLRTTTGASTVS
jgi:hypothetical protein